MIRKNCVTSCLLFFCFLITCCSQSNENRLSGYIEGEYTYISSSIGGTLIKLAVSRGEPVQQNDLLYTLDQEPDLAFMEAASANVQQLKPEVAFAKIQLARKADLFTHNAASKADLDQAQTDYDSKVEALLSAQKSLTQAQWSLQQKTSFAPVAGSVFDTFYRVGEKVAANQPVLALLAPANIHLLFYIPENKLSTIHLGQKVYFDCDGCKRKTAAIINYISPTAEYTPPIIYSRETRYSLVYLVRAKMPNEVAVKFHPGQPTDIYLND